MPYFGDNIGCDLFCKSYKICLVKFYKRRGSKLFMCKHESEGHSYAKFLYKIRLRNKSLLFYNIVYCLSVINDVILNSSYVDMWSRDIPMQKVCIKSDIEISHSYFITSFIIN